ncbi:MAG: hypothetical protein K1X48_10565 [Burkholderiaceae bacterium]|nr:hypothetical protein [Burkholderiaceae bacterium]
MDNFVFMIRIILKFLLFSSFISNTFFSTAIAHNLPLSGQGKIILQSPPIPNYPQDIILNAKPQLDFRDKEICTAIFLSWNTIPGASKYVIQRDNRLAFETSSTKFTDFRYILPQTNYTYRIFSVINGKITSQSQAATLKTNCANSFFSKKPLKILVAQIRMKDAKTADKSVDELKQIVFDDEKSIANYFLKVSSGAIEMKGEVITGLTLNKNVKDYCQIIDNETGAGTQCNNEQLAADVYALLLASATVDADLFAFVIHGYGEAGWGEAYNRRTLLNPYAVSISTMFIHELAHVFGWWHSGSISSTNPEQSSLNCISSSTNTPSAGGCRGNRYGDYFDFTGASNNQIRNPSTYRKALLNFLAPAESPLIVSKTGTYILQANSSVYKDTSKELRIPLDKTGKNFYSLEYRIPTGLDDVVMTAEEKAFFWLAGDEGQIQGKLKGVMVRQRFDYAMDEDTDAFLIKQLIRPGVGLYDPYRGIKIEWLEELSNDRVKLKISFPLYPILPLKAAF